MPGFITRNGKSYQVYANYLSIISSRTVKDFSLKRVFLSE